MEMKIQFFNSLTSKKEEFEPYNADHIKIYACGPTIYKAPHIGNFRSFVVFDTLVKFLSTFYPKVSYVRNITDVDDKIIEESIKRNITCKELTGEVYDQFKSDSKLLNIADPTSEPFATEYVEKMVQDIEKLVENKFAYVKDGHVFFDTCKYENYRDFCKNMDSEAGSRIAITDLKSHENDFVLWKPSKDVFWTSPWGNGRPGWHIECTSMSKSILGLPFDIHCGGQDLIFPHHTNEKAQGWGLCNVECAKYWMHNHFVNVDNNKMSKSLDNQLDLQALMKDYHPMVLRLFLLMSHYRHPLNWNAAGLQEASNIYTKWHKLLVGIKGETPLKSIVEALSDDLNTPLAIKKISEALKNSESLESIAKSCEIIGITFDENEVDKELIDKLIIEREAARKDKNYQESDRIRKLLQDMNIIIEDTKDGIKWWCKS